MMTARNLAEMKQALSHLQLMAQNIMVATVQGDIYYLRNGRVPIRAEGVDPSRPIPGNTSATEWKGIHPMSDLVQIENPPVRLDAELQLLARGDDEPDQPTPEQFRGASSPLQRIAVARRPPARRDGDRPARTPPTR